MKKSLEVESREPWKYSVMRQPSRGPEEEGSSERADEKGRREVEQ